jgi:uncharacterized membrane protein HdeD (DUF308 family)
MLLEHFTRQWWTFTLRGVLAIAFGILVIAAPQVAVPLIVFVFGIYALADGVASLAALLRPHWESGWWLALSGIVGIGAGVVALLWPGMTALALLMVIAVWAFVIGIMELSAAIAYGREVDNAWLLGLSGIVFIGFGILSFLWPASGLVGVLALIATFSIIHGIMLLVVGGRMRNLRTRVGDVKRIPLTPVS